MEPDVKKIYIYIVKAVVVYGPMEIIKVHLFVTSETHIKINLNVSENVSLLRMTLICHS